MFVAHEIDQPFGEQDPPPGSLSANGNLLRLLRKYPFKPSKPQLETRQIYAYWCGSRELDLFFFEKLVLRLDEL